MDFKVTRVGGKHVTLMAGYLYAIAHGAKVIYSSDGFSGPSDRLLSESSRQTISGLRFRSEQFFNPYQHFGQPQLFKQYHIHKGQPPKIRETMYYTNEWKTPLIMKEMVDGLHKAESRLNGSTIMRGDVNVAFDQCAPMAIVTEASYTSFESMNTLYLYDSFFALLKSPVPPGKCSVTWEYWTQRLIWEVEGGVGFLVSNNETGRYKAVDTPLSPMEMHTDNRQIPHLRRLLKSWQCTPRVSAISTCMKDLTQVLVENAFWPTQYILLIDAWISDLKSVGYNEPRRIRLGGYKRNCPMCNIRPTYFWPSLQYVPDKRIPKFQGYELGEKKTCGIIMKACGVEIMPTKLKNLPYEGKKIRDILLLVVFNFPLYQNIEVIEYIYARHFAHVLYCGEKHETFENFNRYFTKPISYIESRHYHGFLGYDCMIQAMRMGYNVNGYLHMGDDVLLNVWNLYDLPRDKIWFQSSMRIADRSATSVPDLHKSPEWGPWNEIPGKRSLVPLWETLEELSIENEKGKDVQQFLKTLQENTGSPLGVMYEASDIFYVPSRLAERYMFYASLFFKHGVFLEIAVPTILNAIENNTKIYRLKGRYLWFEERDKYVSMFKESNLFIHAWKFRCELRKSDGVRFFCNTLLPRIQKDLNS